MGEYSQGGLPLWTLQTLRLEAVDLCLVPLLVCTGHRSHTQENKLTSARPSVQSPRPLSMYVTLPTPLLIGVSAVFYCELRILTKNITALRVSRACDHVQGEFCCKLGKNTADDLKEYRALAGVAQWTECRPVN